MVAQFSRDAMVVASATGVEGHHWPITYVNPAFERMTGYVADDVLGQSLRILQGPETDAEVLNRITARLRSGDPSRETVLNYRKDGTPFWTELDINPVTNSAGDVTHWVSIQRDVTDRYESEMMFSGVSRKTPGMLYTYRLFPDGSSCFPYASGALEQLYGLTAKAIREDARPIIERLHPDDLDGVMRTLKASEEKLSPWKFSFRSILPDGRIVRLYNNALPTRLPDGSTIWHGYVHDLDVDVEMIGTEMRAIFDAIPAAVFMKDTESRILMMNATCEEQWGISFLDLLGTDGSPYFPPEQIAQFVADDRVAFATPGGLETDEFLWNAKLQENRTCHTFKRTIADITGKPRYLVGIAFDTTEASHAAAALRASEEKLRGLFEMSPLGFVLTNFDGKYIEFNQAFSEICGYSLEEIPAIDYWKLTPEEYWEVDRRQLAMVKQLGRFGPYEKEYIHKDGARVPVQLTGTVVTGGDGRKYIWSIVENITARRNQQASAARLAAIVESSNDAIIGKTLSGHITFWNAAAAKMFGYTSEEVVGQHVAMLFPPDQRDEEQFIIASVARGERVENYETLRLRKDGRTFPVSVTVSPILDAQGKVVAASKIVRDITAKKESEALHSHFEAIVRTSVDAIISVDLDGIITTWNAAAETIYGYSAAEAIGQPGLMICPPDHQDELFRRARRGERVGRFRTMRVNRAGDFIPVEVNAAPIFNEAGSIVGVSGIERDLRERERIEEQLRQSQKMEAIGNLTGGLAHDFNNLLAVIMGNLDLLESTQTISSENAELVTDAIAAAERGGELTRRLLAFARKQPLKFRTFHLHDLVDDTVGLLKRLLGENINIVIQHEPGVCAVTTDEVQLATALTNLATNARDAMPEGGTLTIQTKHRRIEDENQLVNFEIPPGDYAVIVVTDTGIGIPRESVSRIFEPFFTTKSRDQGTGLGLSMVFGFMKQSGGHINVYSEVGEGTTFRLYLPCRVEAEGEAIGVSEPVGNVGSGQKILIVEDNPALRRVLKAQLERLSYTVLEAGTGAEALEILAASSVDLVFTDIVMPGGVDGYELARRVQSAWPQTRILLTSGFPDRRIPERDADGQFRLLTKPYRERDLAIAIAEALSHNRGAQFGGQ